MHRGLNDLRINTAGLAFMVLGGFWAAPGNAQPTCDEVITGIEKLAVDETARGRSTVVQNRQSYVWTWQAFLRVMNKHPACDAGDREMQAEHVRSAQMRCRSAAESSPAGSFNCEDGRNYWGTMERTEGAIRELLQEAPGGAAKDGPAGGSAIPR